jgi:hypothetical protein
MSEWSPGVQPLNRSRGGAGAHFNDSTITATARSDVRRPWRGPISGSADAEACDAVSLRHPRLRLETMIIYRLVAARLQDIADVRSVVYRQHARLDRERIRDWGPGVCRTQ